jgi:hypothetical protein
MMIAGVALQRKTYCVKRNVSYLHFVAYVLRFTFYLSQLHPHLVLPIDLDEAGRVERRRERAIRRLVDC